MKKLSLSNANFTDNLLSSEEKRNISGGRSDCMVQCICGWGTGWYPGPSCPFDCDQITDCEY